MPHALTMVFNAFGMFMWIPSILALMAMHKHRATSILAKPSSNAQHGLDVGVPITGPTTPPRRSMHTLSFNMSFEQVAAGVGGHGGFGGGGDGSMHVLQALEMVARRRREKMKMGVE